MPPTLPPAMPAADGGAGTVAVATVTAFVLCAASLLPSELCRLCTSAPVSRRLFEPRLERLGPDAALSAVRPCSRWPLSWLWASWATDDTRQEVVNELGLDAAVYMGTARLGLQIVLYLCVFDLAVVLPCNMAGGNDAVRPAGHSNLAVLTIANIEAGSPLLWAHAVSACLRSLLVLLLLDRFSDWVQRQQQAELRASLAEDSPASRTVLATQLPSGEPVRLTVEAWHGRGCVECVVPVVRHTLVAPLAAELDRLRLLARATHRRRTSAADGGCGAADWAAGAASGAFGGRLSSAPGAPASAALPGGVPLGALRPQDAAHAAELAARLAAVRVATLTEPPSAARGAALLRPAAFITFRSAGPAAVAGQVLHSSDGSTWGCSPAPQPGNVVWKNGARWGGGGGANGRVGKGGEGVNGGRRAGPSLPVPPLSFPRVPARADPTGVPLHAVGRWDEAGAAVRQALAWVLVLLLCLCYLLPASFIQGLAHQTGVNALLRASGPPVALFALQWICPLILRALTLWQGAVTWAAVDQGMIAKSFLFNLVIVLIASLLGSDVLVVIPNLILHSSRELWRLIELVPRRARARAPCCVRGS